MDQMRGAPDDARLRQRLVSGFNEKLIRDVLGADGFIRVKEGLLDFAVEAGVVVGRMHGGFAADDDGPFVGGVAKQEGGVEGDPFLTDEFEKFVVGIERFVFQFEFGTRSSMSTLTSLMMTSRFSRTRF